MDERYPEVNKMAAVVLAKPAATAREIARELRYAQPRSVYYWLRKAGFNGLAPFRHAVLTGAYPVAASPRGPFKPRAEHVAEVPLAHGDGPDDDDQYVVTTRNVGDDAFALKVPTDEYAPLFQRDDIVIVDPTSAVEQGDLVAVRTDDGDEKLCRAYPGRRPLYVHPGTGRPLGPSEDEQGPLQGPLQILGKIVSMQRHF